MRFTDDASLLSAIDPDWIEEPPRTVEPEPVAWVGVFIGSFIAAALIVLIWVYVPSNAPGATPVFGAIILTAVVVGLWLPSAVSCLARRRGATVEWRVELGRGDSDWLVLGLPGEDSRRAVRAELRTPRPKRAVGTRFAKRRYDVRVVGASGEMRVGVARVNREHDIGIEQWFRKLIPEEWATLAIECVDADLTQTDRESVMMELKVSGGRRLVHVEGGLTLLQLAGGSVNRLLGDDQANNGEDARS